MDPNTVGQVLRFDVGALKCAVPLGHVREIQRAVAITPLPGAPPIIEGVIDVRGDILPVIDTGARLGVPPRPIRASDRLILLSTGGRVVALRADAVHWIEDLPEQAFAEADRLTRGAVAVAGVVRTSDGLILLQDPDGLLRQAEEESLDEALAAAAATR